jgi:uncharacterized protein YkwD
MARSIPLRLLCTLAFACCAIVLPAATASAAAPCANADILSGDLATPRQSVVAWLNSPGHRRNMLNRKFRDIGIGITIGAPEDISGQPAATYATEFGTRSFR